MSRHAQRTRRVAATALAPLLAFSLAAAASSCAHRGGGSAGVGGPGEMAAGRPLRPPEARWLVDEQGREFSIQRLPRSQAARVGPDDVRSYWGIRLDVVREDADFYYYKVYRPPEEPATPTPEPDEEEAPSPERVRAARERYRVTLRESRRLDLAPFGAGLPTAGQWRESFAVADMNGDRRPDVVHGPPRKAPGRPAIFLGDGAGGWKRWREAQWPALPYDYGSAAVGDLNADGAPDLVLGIHLGGVLVLVGDGRGTFRAWGEGVEFAPGGSAFSSRAVAIADADGDGRPDVVALGEGPRMGGFGAPPPPPATGLLLYRNRGDGTWARDDASAGGRRLFGSSIAAGDFDGDGRTDFATGSGVLGRRDVINLARPAGGWEAVEVAGVRPGGIVRSVAAADFDRDGRSDLVVAYQSREEQWRTGADVILAPGSAAERVLPLVVAEEIEGAAAVGVGDFDGDGDADVVVGTDRGGLLLFPGDGAGGFVRERAGTAPFGGGCRASHVTLADADGDGAAEVFASFALEDGGDEEGPPRCPDGGGLAAWKVVPRR